MLTTVGTTLAHAASRVPRLGFVMVRAIANACDLGIVRARTVFGPWLAVDLREPNCYSVFKRGRIKSTAPEEAWFRAHLRRHDVIFDVGANIGYMTIQFAQLASGVHAFEPSPRALRLLRETATQFDNVVVLQRAVSDQAGEVRFSEEADLHLSSVGHGDLAVPATTLDHYVEETGVEPTFVKIDVEGHEPAVLRGATRLLGRGPRVFFEALSDAALAEATAVLVAANPAYSVERIAPGNRNFIATASR